MWNYITMKKVLYSLENIVSFFSIQFIFMNNNNIYTSLQLFLLYWLFPLLLVLTISLVYSLYFHVPHLCDDNVYTLFQLKNNLTSEIANFRTCLVNHECYSELHKQSANYWPREGWDSSYQESLNAKIRSSQILMTQSVDKIREIEDAIKVIEPKFRSSINYNNYNHIILKHKWLGLCL
jgi:hypothetical protein